MEWTIIQFNNGHFNASYHLEATYLSCAAFFIFKGWA